MAEVVDEAGVHGVGGNAQIFGNWTMYNVDIQGTHSQKYSIVQYFHTANSTQVLDHVHRRHSRHKLSKVLYIVAVIQ